MLHSPCARPAPSRLSTRAFAPPPRRQDYVDKAPGELGEFGAFAKPVDVEEWEKVQLAEIKHGRLAMLAVVGALVQETVTGEGAVEQLFTGNVSTVVEKKLGSVGFSCVYVHRVNVNAVASSGREIPGVFDSVRKTFETEAWVICA